MAIMIRSKKAALIVKKILGIPTNEQGSKKSKKKDEDRLDYNDASELR